jgi:predicted small secreted protein
VLAFAHLIDARWVASNRRLTMLRKSVALVFVAGTLFLAGCNTVDGAGKDLSSASQDVKEEINK